MASDLLKALRAASSPAIWSKAVELARANNVSAVGSDFRVATDGGLKSALVTLYPEDAEWSCDCDSTAEACVHACAAAIAWNKSKLDGKPLASSALAHVAYRFRSDNGALFFDREIGGVPLEGTLTELSRNGVKFAATTADMTIEVTLGTRPRGSLTPDHWRRLWPSLRECEDVTVDGKKVTLDDPRAITTLYVRDAGPNFLLVAEPRRGVGDFTNGPVLDGDRLFLKTVVELPETLRRGRTVRPDEVEELVLEVLPRLREQVPVVVETTRLPEAVEAEVRITFDVQPQGPGLSVLATLKYDAPFARKKPAVEQRLKDELSRKFGLKAGERKFFNAEEAPELLGRLGKKRVIGVVEAHTEAGVLQLSMRAGEHTVDHATLLHALRGGQSLISLPGGIFGEIPAPLRDLDLVARLLHGRAALSPVEKLDASRLLRALETPLPPDLEPLAALLDGTPPPCELPKDLTATLRDYQRQGVEWLMFMQQARLGALLADDMGLGKTLQAIASLGEGRHLVVAPTSVLGVWEKELARFRPSLEVLRYHGARRTLRADVDVVLTTYGTLRQDVAALSRETFATVVLDEAQAIKNIDSQAARACFELKAEHRVALSGTPIENSYDELVSLFRFLNPGYVATPDRVRPFILRRKKEQVARDLPPRTDNVLLCELSEEERAIYDATHSATVPSVLAALDESNNVMSALEALLRLRQAASHPRLLPGYESWAGSSAKIDALLGTLESLVAEGHKALVFSQWTSFLDIVQDALKGRGIAETRLDGSTVDRAGVVNAFEATDGPPVMLISLKAGGTGLTLTSADYVFLMDPWWNPAVEEQAAARAHRIGQTKPVFVYRLIAKGSVEERLLALQEQKRALFDAVLGDEALAQRMTRDELRQLLA